MEPPEPRQILRPTACADRRRPQGPAAADAGALRALLDPAASFDAPKNRAEDSPGKVNHEKPRLTGPAPSGMTSTFLQLTVGLSSADVRPDPRSCRAIVTHLVTQLWSVTASALHAMCPAKHASMSASSTHS